MNTWPDIIKVPLWGTLPKELSKLPRVSDRLAASLFYLQDSSQHVGRMKDPSDVRTGAVRWLSWASLVALSSARESVSLDLAALGLPDTWKTSPEHLANRADPLLAVTHELRNYAVHFDLPASVPQNFRAMSNGQEFDFGQEPYFVPIDWKEFSQLNNIQRSTPTVTEDMVNWFNQQCAVWPVVNILGVARERFADSLALFAKREIK